MVRLRAVTCGTSREEAPTFGDKEGEEKNIEYRTRNVEFRSEVRENIEYPTRNDEYRREAYTGDKLQGKQPLVARKISHPIEPGWV